MANTATKTNTENKPKMVTIKIPRSRVEKEDVWVSVNGEKYLIQRGVNVEVPDYVAEVLEHKDEMLEEGQKFESQAAQNADQ